MSEITLALQRMKSGDARAADELMNLVYGELRRLAAHKMAREAMAHTLQPTALVHEAWLRLGGSEQGAWENRAHFFSAAAEAMRRILIDRARRRRAERHGGEMVRVGEREAEQVAAVAKDEELLAVHEALERLEALDRAKADLVKLRYFVGLSIPEAAQTMGISEVTAKRWWAFARAWLFQELRSEPPAGIGSNSRP